jgi:hypothetical protein
MGQVGSLLTGQDPFEDDKRKQYEGERRKQAQQCGSDIKAAVWDGVTGHPADGAAKLAKAVNGPSCNNGPWRPPSQRPAPTKSTAPGEFQLKPPGDLKWPG